MSVTGLVTARPYICGFGGAPPRRTESKHRDRCRCETIRKYLHQGDAMGAAEVGRGSSDAPTLSWRSQRGVVRA